MDVVAYVLPAFILKLAVLMPGATSAVISHYMHPDCSVESSVDTGEYNASLACWAALHMLDWRGVENIQICEVMKIEAPLSGYLVDALGTWERGERQFTVFRIGIRNDDEDPTWAGHEFVFLAAGFSEDGEVFIHPPGAGTANPDGNFTWEHEYLLSEEEFLSIPQRFPL